MRKSTQVLGGRIVRLSDDVKTYLEGFFDRHLPKALISRIGGKEARSIGANGYFSDPVDPQSPRPFGHTVNIEGTARDYEVSYAAGFVDAASPGPWTSIAKSRGGVIDGILAKWNTAKLNGKYTVKLVATNRPGITSHDTRNIVLDNTDPTGRIGKVAGVDSQCRVISKNRIPRGIADVEGSAHDAHFWRYYLQYIKGANDIQGETKWDDITVSSTPVGPGPDARLASWDISALEPCSYVLYLRVYDRTIADNDHTAVYVACYVPLQIVA